MIIVIRNTNSNVRTGQNRTLTLKIFSRYFLFRPALSLILVIILFLSGCFDVASLRATRLCHLPDYSLAFYYKAKILELQTLTPCFDGKILIYYFIKKVC